MNVMLTCAGRRSHMIAIFQDAVKGRGEVFACDAQADAPALQAADEAFVVPAVDDPSYVDALLALCDAHRVGLLIPALEPELPLLAAHRARFAAVGTVPVVSSSEIVATCYDKLETNRFLARCGLPVAPTFGSLPEAREALRRGELHFPLVVKPRWGVSSFAVAFPEDEEELELAYRLARKQLARSFLAQVSARDPEHCVLIQEKLGGTEYGLDIVNDLEGRYVTTFAKRKIRMRAGQTDRAVTVQDERLAKLGAQIGQALAHVGLLDCDIFAGDDECYAIDLNPRIGGGYPFSHLAGANLPAALIAWARGETPDPRWLEIQSGVAGARFEAFSVTHRSEPVPAVLNSCSND
jgi:carbamoyl-phosphate synthase large subunit